MGQERVVRPGQESVLAEMLGRGAELPGPCAFTGGRIEGGTIAATYACPGGDVVLELRDPRSVAAPAATTEQFALTTPGGQVPPALLEAVVAHIRARESAFAWSAADSEKSPAAPNDPGVAYANWSVLFIAIVSAAAAVALGRAWLRGGARGVLVTAKREARRALVSLLCVAGIALAAEAAYRVKLFVDVPRPAADTSFDLYGVGESTMVGEPFEAKISVPRMLEYMFDGVIAGRPVAVKNLAERGVPIYPQALAFDRALESGRAGTPGVVLIMSGHNEGFVPASARTQSPYLVSLVAERSAIVRDVLLAVRRRRWVGREHSLAAYEYYLRHVIEAAQRNGLVPILTTMASNISSVEPNTPAEPADAVAGTIEQGLALEEQGAHAAARDLYLSRVAADHSPAMLYYRAGRCEEKLGDFRAARDYYWTAVDEDPRSLFGRATRAQNEIVRRLAREYGVPLVDAVRILEEHSAHGILGDDLFMDGQHPTLTGYVYLANAYAQIISDRFETPILSPLPDEDSVEAALGVEPRDTCNALIDAGSWLIATSVGHPFPHDRMALARKRFGSVLGKGDEFSAWFGIALTQAAGRGGLLRSPDDVHALGGLLGYRQSYIVESEKLSSLLARFQQRGVDAEVLEHLQRSRR